MKQHKIYTLVILLTTFALLWENEKVLTSSFMSTVTSVNANDWLKDNYSRIKNQGKDTFISHWTDQVEHWASTVQSR